MTELIDGMEVIAHGPTCSGKSCPTIYRKDADTIVVQGYEADDLFSTPLPGGERAVSIPVSLLRDMQL